MRVGIVVNERNAADGGGYSVQSRISRALSQVESKHQFILLDRMESVDSIRADGLPVIGLKPHFLTLRFRSMRLCFPPAAWALLKRANAQLLRLRGVLQKRPPESLLAKTVRSQKIDIVWFISPEAEFLPCPVFMTVWDLQHRLQPWFPEVSQSGWPWQSCDDHYQRYLPRASRVITGTHAGKNEIVHFYRLPPENVKVIPLPAPTITSPVPQAHVQETLLKYGIEGDYFLYPAQFWPHKNHINLLHAFAIAKAQYTDIPRLLFTGSDKGNQSYVAEQSTALGLDKEIRFLGFIPQKDLDVLYQGAVAMVFPTLCGPDNLPPLEAFAHGCPVIASTVTGSEEQLGDAVLRVDATQPEEIAKAMLTLLSSESLRQALRSKGFERAEKLAPSSYVSQVCAELDAFEPLRRCWRVDYVHL